MPICLCFRTSVRLSARTSTSSATISPSFYILGKYPRIWFLPPNPIRLQQQPATSSSYVRDAVDLFKRNTKFSCLRYSYIFLANVRPSLAVAPSKFLLQRLFLAQFPAILSLRRSFLLAINTSDNYRDYSKYRSGRVNSTLRIFSEKQGRYEYRKWYFRK